MVVMRWIKTVQFFISLSLHANFLADLLIYQVNPSSRRISAATFRCHDDVPVPVQTEDPFWQVMQSSEKWGLKTVMDDTCGVKPALSKRNDYFQVIAQSPFIKKVIDEAIKSKSQFSQCND